MTDAPRTAVLGAGSWGTALAVSLASTGHPVTLWARRPEAAEALRTTRRNEYLPEAEIPASVEVTSDLGAAVDGADVTFRLEGAPEGREVDWRLRITSVEGGALAEDFDLYTATTTLDGTEGSWTLQYPVEGVPTPVLTADYAVRAEADREVTFRVPAGRERAGSSVRYRVDGGAWTPLGQDLTAIGEPTTLEVEEAAPVLVAR